MIIWIWVFKKPIWKKNVKSSTRLRCFGDLFLTAAWFTHKQYSTQEIQTTKKQRNAKLIWLS